MKKKKTIRQLKKQADTVFSLWIRNRDKKCFTCGSTKNLQCGHFVSRDHNSLRYSELNCNTQCLVCNCFKHGNMPEYAERLMKLYGPYIIRNLNKEKRIVKQFKREELENIINKYKI